MKIGQKPNLKQTLSAALGCGLAATFAASANAGTVSVGDVTDWSTTPNEVVNVTDPYLNYNGGVYAGINTLSVNDGTTTTIHSGFCIDPFHWSITASTPGYSIVPLVDAPKSPAALTASTALQIEDLWAEFFSPTMSSSSAAGLQIAIWEIVSANAVANDGLPANEAFSLAPGQSDYGASADIASLATYTGPAANLEALTGPGQDYVIDPPASVPDGGQTLLMLGLTLGALFVAKPSLIQLAGGQGKACHASSR
jgi:hypothetical protein